MGITSRLVKVGGSEGKDLKSQLVKAGTALSYGSDRNASKDYVWGAVAHIKIGNDITLNSEELDFEFEVGFDDNLEQDEYEIIVYNLSDATINEIKTGYEIEIEAGYKGDIGLIYQGYVEKVKTKYEESDKVTTIKIRDKFRGMLVPRKVNLTFEASEDDPVSSIVILASLLRELNYPIKKDRMRYGKSHMFTESVTIDEVLESAIKRFSEISQLSTFCYKGGIYCLPLKGADEVMFAISEDTGMIGSPAEFEEEVTEGDMKYTTKGLEIDMLLQHRLGVGYGVELKSRQHSGTYYIKSCRHIFNESECVSKIKAMSSINAINTETEGEAKG